MRVNTESYYKTLKLKEKRGREGGLTSSGGMAGSIVVFCEDAGAILRAEDYDSIDGEQGHARCHDCGVRY